MSAPQQARSRATEERILRAAERLLQRGPVTDMGIAELAGEAGVSVGGFYARFGSKDEFVRVLHARYEERRTRFLSEALDPERWRNAPSEVRVRGVVTAFVTLFRDNRHLLRSFLLRYWSRPEEAEGAFAERLEGLYDQAVAVLLLDAPIPHGPDRTRAARTALAVVTGACRDMLVMKPDGAPGAIRRDSDELVDALTLAASAILRIDGTDKVRP